MSECGGVVLVRSFLRYVGSSHIREVVWFGGLTLVSSDLGIKRSPNKHVIKVC